MDILIDASLARQTFLSVLRLYRKFSEMANKKKSGQLIKWVKLEYPRLDFYEYRVNFAGVLPSSDNPVTFTITGQGASGFTTGQCFISIPVIRSLVKLLDKNSPQPIRITSNALLNGNVATMVKFIDGSAEFLDEISIDTISQYPAIDHTSAYAALATYNLSDLTNRVDDILSYVLPLERGATGYGNNGIILDSRLAPPNLNLPTTEVTAIVAHNGKEMFIRLQNGQNNPVQIRENHQLMGIPIELFRLVLSEKSEDFYIQHHLKSHQLALRFGDWQAWFTPYTADTCANYRLAIKDTSLVSDIHIARNEQYATISFNAKDKAYTAVFNKLQLERALRAIGAKDDSQVSLLFNSDPARNKLFAVSVANSTENYSLVVLFALQVIIKSRS